MLVKKAINTFRFVVDLKKANTSLKLFSFTLISLEHVIDRLSLKKIVYLSQIHVREQDRDISSFVTGDSSYRYTR